MLDYRLSRLFYDLHTDRTLAADYRGDRPTIAGRYRLSPATLDALERDDIGYLAQRTNPFLLRYYFIVVGMTEHTFIVGLRHGAALAAGAAADG